MTTYSWINQAYLKAQTPLNNNIDVLELQSHVETAQLLYTREILGELLYNDLTSKIQANTLTSKETSLVDFLKQAIANRAAELAIPFLAIKIRNKGTVRLQDEMAQPSTLEDMKYLRHELKNRAEAFEMMAKNFLNRWSADFPLWLNTTDVTIFPNFDSSFDSDIYLDNPCIDCNQRVSYGKNQNPNP